MHRANVVGDRAMNQPLRLLHTGMASLAMFLIATLATPLLTTLAFAQEPAPRAPAAPAIEIPAVEPVEPAEPIERSDDFDHQRRRHDGEGNVVVHIGDDSTLPAGDNADAVIAMFGSAITAGEVYEAVVAIAGDANVTGPVGEGVVALFGNVHVDAPVGRDVVAVFGDLTLGPNAIIGGEVVSVGGVITRDPAAIVRGGQQQIAFGENFGRLEWLKPWLENCLLYARPLAFGDGLEWAWWTAFGFLGLYVLIALLFDDSVRRCVTTLEERPLQTVVASIVAVLLSPVMLILLTITVIGAMLVPFIAIALFCAALFGKAVVLATLGRRITRFTGIAPLGHVAVATLLGGLMVMVMYVVPVFGFIAYNVIGILGLGVVIYTLMLTLRTNSSPAAPTMAAAGVAPQVSMDDSTVPPPAAPPLEPRPINPSDIELTALPRAGFWIRMGALFIDAVLIGVLVSALEPSEHVFLLVLAGYGALMWKLKGTTIGGIICNVRVVRTDGRDIEWETAIVRALSCFLSLLPAGLGFIWMVFDPNRQTWHDKIAGTVVVRVPRNQPLV